MVTQLSIKRIRSFVIYQKKSVQVGRGRYNLKYKRLSRDGVDMLSRMRNINGRYIVH